MKKGLLSVLCGLFAAVLLLPPFLVFAQPAEVPQTPEPVTVPEVASNAAILFNPQSEQLLYEKNADARIYPAAFTKLMTALLCYEYRATAGNVNVTVTAEMLSSAGGTSMKLQEGETLTFDDLLAGLVVQNANDAALVLASVVGGNISAFVEKMNERAKALGMEHTYYANPTGVDSAVMYSTLRDTLTLCTALYRVNDFMILSETPKITIPATNLSKERTYTNKNALIPYSYVTDYYMKGARGMAAGYTSGAGYCVATVHQKADATYFALVSGGEDRSEAKNQRDISSYRDAKALLEWAESTFSIRQILPKGKVICEKNVRLGAGVDHVILVTGRELFELLPIAEDLESEITYEIKTEKQTFSAPIIEGKEYGTLDVLYRGQILASVPLVAQTNIGLSRWLVMWDAVLGFFSQGPAKVVLILVICAAVLYVLILIGTVWVQYARKNQAKNLAIKEINEQEKQRMKKVRMEEKKASQARLHRVKIAIREGYRVLSGDEETKETAHYRSAPPRKAVAKVPEKYRKEHRAPYHSPADSPPARRSTQRPPVAERRAPAAPRAERYRVAPRPANAGQPRPASHKAPAHANPNVPPRQTYRARPASTPKPKSAPKANTRRWPD